MWNTKALRLVSALFAVALVAAACGGSADTTTAAAPADTVEEATEAATPEAEADDAMEDMEAMEEDEEGAEHDAEHGDGEGDSHEHDHAAGLEVDASLPIPGLELQATETDTPGVFTLAVSLENFTPTPENIDADPIDNEGHMHYLIDGVRIDRFTDLQIEVEVPEGEHLVEVELNSNNHQAYTIDGEPIRAGVTLTGAGAAPEADVVLAASFVGGEIQLDGSDRFEVAEGDLVMVTIDSDAADEVHVHGYDIFADVAPDEDAMITFTANIPGRFEIEFEQSGIFIAELVVS